MRRVLPVLTLAVGLAVGAGGTYLGMSRTPRTQQGEFTTVGSEEGRVNFPVPYSSPPNVTLEPIHYEALRESTVVTSVDERGFNWRINTSLVPKTQGKLSWLAKGL